MNGILLVDKPLHWTSFDVVAKVRNLVRQSTGVKKPKVGHAGTLDPRATGLLIILIGDYCKRASEFSKLDKTYQAELVLGETSTTDDAEGDIKSISSRKPKPEEIYSVAQDFSGEIQQTPPAFSAIKIDGKRAYKLAREGKQPEIKARPVTIYSIKEIDYEYPKLAFITEVNSGTYIRSLARDIGNKLGTGAYLTQLRRTDIDRFNIKDAQQIDTLTAENLSSKIIEQ